LELKRYELGLTQVEVAERAGLSQASVSQAETGAHLSPKTAKALADLYGISVAEVLGVTPELVMPRRLRNGGLA
jgi:transcriptional regulator with XRE-family HTH domain